MTLQVQPNMKRNLFAANLLLDQNSIEELVSDGFDIVQIARQLGTNVNLLLLKLQQMNDDNRFRLPDMPIEISSVSSRMMPATFNSGRWLTWLFQSESRSSVSM